MSQITLNKLTIENFKGIKSFELNLDGKNAVIKAENGIGKTTIYDSFLWLLFGKDSTGRKEFNLQPLDKRNNPIKGAVITVQAEIDIDGINHIFRKEQHEKFIKKQLTGYETLCWIDEVPKKVSEYAEYIAEMISEEHFKLLTDLHFFNGKMKWTERRKVLLEVAGEIEQPKGFDELLKNLNGRSMDEYKKILSEHKKRYIKERDEINPRIDEILKGLEHPAEDIKGLEKQRGELSAEIVKLKIARQTVHNQETERQAKISKISLLTRQKLMRESELASDMSGIQKLLDEKAEITKSVADAEQLEQEAESSLGLAEHKMTQIKNEREALLQTLNVTREEIKAVESETLDTICYACGQKLPADKVAANQEKKQHKLNEIKEKGNSLKEKIGAKTNQVKSLTKNVDLLKEQHEKVRIEIKQLRENANIQLAAIELKIKNRPTIPPDNDKAWNEIDADIKMLEAELGPSVEKRLTELERERESAQAELNKINEALAQSDRMTKDRSRIRELEEREKELAQSIADCDKLLAGIEQYKALQSITITRAVNGLFKVTEFKMFKELLNGGLEECCEAMLKGVPYSDMSTGEGIYVGVDINNVLSAYYGYSVPLFIDHAESLSLPVESKSQTIKLFMQEGIKQLKIESQKETRKVVA